MTETTLDATIAEQKAKSREIEEKAAEAEGLRRVNEDLRVDIARHEARVAKFRAIGKGHVERKQEMHDPHLGLLRFEPLRSLETVDELADKAQKPVDELLAVLVANEQQIKQLLAE